MAAPEHFGRSHSRVGKDTESALRQELRRAAQSHYRRGNRFFDARAWDMALEEWRRAAGMWQVARSTVGLVGRRLVNLRAALALLLTVGLIYTGIFAFFPRDPFELFMLTGSGLETRPWWERFLDTGRVHEGGGHKMGVREWWERFRRRLRGEEERGVAVRGSGRRTIDERWEELLRRYGRWGPFFNFELDYNVVSGYGLSRLGDYNAAVEVFQRGIRATWRPEKLADLYQGLANAHYYQGYKLQPDGLARYDLYFVRKSMEAYEQSVGYQPRPIAYGNVGWMHFLLGDYEQAERYSRQALSADSGLEYVRLNLGLIYLMQERVYKAFEAYRGIIRRDPPKEVYLGGINDLREVIRDNPGRYPFAFLMVGLLSLKQGDYGAARDALNRFQANPIVGQSWRGLARRLVRDMNTQELTR